jgi:hypothetical protein
MFGVSGGDQPALARQSGNVVFFLAVWNCMIVACQVRNRILVRFPQDPDDLLVTVSTLLHCLLAFAMSYLRRVTPVRKSPGRSSPSSILGDSHFRLVRRKLVLHRTIWMACNHVDGVTRLIVTRWCIAPVVCAELAQGGHHKYGSSMTSRLYFNGYFSDLIIFPVGSNHFHSPLGLPMKFSPPMATWPPSAIATGPCSI